MNCYSYKPILDKKELELIDKLTDRYNNLTQPSIIKKTLKKASSKTKDIIPYKFKDNINKYSNQINEADFYKQVIKVASEGFLIIEQQASKTTVSKDHVLKEFRKINTNITTFEEICTARSYEISKLKVSKNYQDLSFAFIEGGVTGFLGLPGVPFNMVLSLFLYFRTVQSIALFYGYDIKEDLDEMVIASQIFMMALSPNIDAASGSLCATIGKIMTMSKASLLKSSLAKNSFEQMAKNGGVELLFVQLRALAHKSAKKALDKAGAKGIEQSIFSDILEQLAKYMSKNATKKAIPILSAGVGALFDTAYMYRVLKFSEIFYHKRFLIEKNQRIQNLYAENDNDIELAPNSSEL